MNTYLEKLEVTNFKSFPPDKPKVFQFEGNNATIFDGPNGYGKSTVFDSLELLITGDISHFKSTLKNGHTTYLSIIANSDSVPTEIVGHFKKGESSFSIKRIFKWKNKNESELIYYNQEGVSSNIKNDQVYNLLNINQNFFKIGMYISQSDSLLFLQEKYGKRKAMLTSILDMEKIERRTDFVKVLKTKYSEKIKIIKKTLDQKNEDLLLKQQSLEKIIKKTQVGDQLISYNKLFPEKDYSFDIEKIDVTIPFESYETRLKPIKKLVDNYDLYVKSRQVEEIDKILEIQDDQLKKYFYRTKIDSHDNKWWEQLSTLKYCVDSQQFPLEICEFELIKGKISTIELITKYYLDIEIKDGLEKSIQGNKTEIINLNQKRKALYEEHKHQESLDAEQCPFCGNHLDDLEKAYADLTDHLESSMDERQTKVNEYVISLTELTTSISKKINEIIQPFIEDLSLFNELGHLQSLTRIEIVNIEKFIPDFKNIFTESENLVKNYNLLIEQFHARLTNLKGSEETYSKNELIELNQIFEDNFKNEKPRITSKDLDLKYLYIKSKYQDLYLKELQQIKKELIKVEQILSKHNDAEQAEKLVEGIKSYNLRAYQKYQEKFIQKIQLPLFLISGRILQTYQLGLGTYAEVNATQVVFKVAYKEDEMNTDIFNIFSVGQLNGVILSILFAIRKIYSKENQLDIIMIDDPLQSIDEISAHSFADLLVEEFPETQLILSTHEEEKSRLIQYKYQQSSKNANNYNMQIEYLNS